MKLKKNNNGNKNRSFIINFLDMLSMKINGDKCIRVYCNL